MLKGKMVEVLRDMEFGVNVDEWDVQNASIYTGNQWSDSEVSIQNVKEELIKHNFFNENRLVIIPKGTKLKIIEEYNHQQIPGVIGISPTTYTYRIIGTNLKCDTEYEYFLIQGNPDFSLDEDEGLAIICRLCDELEQSVIETLEEGA